MKNYLVMAGIALGVVVVWGALFAPVQRVINQASPLGAVSSPIMNSPYFGFGDNVFWGSHTTLSTASTTLCSLVSPAATSTLVFGDVQITTATSTAMLIELGQSSLMDATTTLINGYQLAANKQVTINATTTLANTASLVFAPSSRFNVKYAGGLGTTNTVDGTCNAVWAVN